MMIFECAGRDFQKYVLSHVCILLSTLIAQLYSSEISLSFISVYKIELILFFNSQASFEFKNCT